MKTKHLTLFDLDHTLLPIDSDQSWGRFTTQVGWTSKEDFLVKNEAFYQDYCRGALDIHAYVRFTTQTIRDKGEVLSNAMRERFIQEVIAPHIKPEALSLVARHQDQGEEVVIITATNEWVTRPIADLFGVSELIALQLSRDDQGWITGEIEGTPSLGPGKLIRLEEWLAKRGLKLSELSTTFYSDSINDAPLLSAVNHPVATNPDDALRALATQKGWPILELFAPA
jgi:HAD superfamily hydrolase (TIGR01490 family)